MFFAALLALLVFGVGLFFFTAGVIGGLAEKEAVGVKEKSVLTVDLSTAFPEHKTDAPFASIGQSSPPTLAEVIRLIRHAKTDKAVAGIWLQAEGAGNGFASSEEIRNALIDFKTSKKFVVAYGTTVPQYAYGVATAADKVYVNPVGGLEWDGFNVTLPFVKGTLEKLEIQPQIFYAGKFKSATETFRTEKMTPENRLQTQEWLGDIYKQFLRQVAAARNVDTATLYQLAASAAVQTPQDAVAAKLIDGAKYDDEVRAEIKTRLGLGRTDRLNTVPLTDYSEAVNVAVVGKDKIAVIYAEGNIVDGEGQTDDIGGERFRALIRQARLNNAVKAIVLRVNSGGGSALASEVIWRELRMARTEDKKPVVVSFGDVAASGGYYIACGADSIFAQLNTITGSIGVFGVIPNMEGFFKNKLGITFDEVNTAPFANTGAAYKPLNEKEKSLVQQSIERIYAQFKSRVAEGRKKDTAYIESIAQGRVWSGEDALRNGLVDRLGGLQNAIDCAARMAKLTDYGLREYPEERNWLQELFNKKPVEPAAMIREELGEENYRLFLQMKKIRAMAGTAQARLPFDVIRN